MSKTKILKTSNFQSKLVTFTKLKKKNSICISVLGYENKEKHQIYVSKKFCEEKHVDLVLIEEKGKKHYVLIKDFNTFMHYYTLHCVKKKKKMSLLFASF